MSRSIACVLGLSFTTPLVAQEAPSPPVFTVQTNMVVVDVVVTDEKGQPVRGLSRDDFEVYEDGALQRLATFEAVELPVSTTSPVRDAAPTLTSNGTVSPERATLVLAFDELHLTPVTTETVRRQLDASWRALGAADVLLFSTAGGGSWLGRLPEDMEALQGALDRFRGGRFDANVGRMTDYEAFLIAGRHDDNVLTEVYRRYLDQQFMPDPTDVLPEPPKRMRGQKSDEKEAQPAIGQSTVKAEAEQRWRQARVRQAATLESLVRLLGGLSGRPGRKAVILVSEGFIHDPAVLEHRELVEAARRARAVVHVIDPRNRGVLGHDAVDFLRDVDVRDSLQAVGRAQRDAEGTDALADATGGRIVRSLQGLPRALSHIGDELRTYYLLGYAPPGASADGKYHQLKVALKRSGLKLAARPGYFAMASPALRTARPSATPALQAALASPFDDAGLPIQLAAFVLGRGPGGGSVVRLVAEVETTGVTSPGTLDAVFLLATQRSSTAQQAVLAAPVASGGRVRLEQQFEAGPGLYQARLVVRDRNGDHRLGSVRHSLEVKPADDFRLSTPILTDVLLPDQAPLARAERRFAKGTTLHCLVEVFGTRTAAVQAGLELRGADGRLILQIPEAPIASLPPSRHWAIPLKDLPAGRYELVISVEAAGRAQRLLTREPFEVLAAPSSGPTA